MLKQGCILFTALLLAGCETAGPDLAPLVQIAPAACSGTLEIGQALSLPFDIESKNKRTSIIVDEGSACLAEGDRKSLYRVFALPDVGQPFMLTVQSKPGSRGIFAPRLIMLDDEGARLREIGYDEFMFRGSALTAIFRTEPGERYMAIASDPEQVGSEFSRLSGSVQQQMMTTGVVTFAAYTGSETTANLTYAHNGVVDVSARPIPTR